MGILKYCEVAIATQSWRSPNGFEKCLFFAANSRSRCQRRLKRTSFTVLFLKHMLRSKEVRIFERKRKGNASTRLPFKGRGLFPRKYPASENPHLSPENEKAFVQTQAGFKVTLFDILKKWEVCRATIGYSWILKHIHQKVVQFVMKYLRNSE